MPDTTTTIENMPKHIAIISDGNRRWAKSPYATFANGA